MKWSKCGNVWHRNKFLINLKCLSAVIASLTRRGSAVRTRERLPLIQSLRQFLSNLATENHGKSSLWGLYSSVANSWHRLGSDKLGLISNFQALKGKQLPSLSQSNSKNTSLGEGASRGRGNGS